LVLKDGQIVEQGSHKELLAQDGIFASMWADQVSSTDDPAHSIGETSVKRETSGYVAEEQEPSPVVDGLERASPDDTDAALEPSFPAPADDQPGGDTEDSPGMSAPIVPSSQPATDAPASMTPSTPPAAEPLAFPVKEEDVPPRDRVAPVPPNPASGVTFGDDVNPSRTGTPDPESEPKRKRISSQNFQRLARRISLTTRRQSSTSIIPGLKRDSSSRVSTESSNQGILRTESPSGSVKGDGDKGKSKKKEKKDKSKKGSN